MNRGLLRFFCVAMGLLAFPQRSPAPLIYTAGEGWRYEQVGATGSWMKTRAKDQLDVAQASFDQKDFGTAMKAARRTVTQWPFSDYAPQAQYLLARCYEAKGQDEKAFKAYQKLIERYPKIDNYDDIITSQFRIANRYLAGQWFKVWNYIPAFPSMDKTIKMYEQVIKNGPYSEVAPVAQMNIGTAHENRRIKDYPGAAKAYERAADRYSEQKVGVDALYKVGQAYTKQAKTAEYDQSIAAQAIATFTDFATLHPEDARVPEALKHIDELKTEQARGSFEIARYYDKHGRWRGALIYYNEVLLKDPNSPFAEAARLRIDTLKKREAP